MNIEKGNSLKEINLLLQGSGRIEQIYLVIDRTVKIAKEIYPASYCITCPLTCCINDLYLPVSFLEWKAIEFFLDKKTDDNTRNTIKENLEKIPPDLFKTIDEGKNEQGKYKDKSCPLLINNKCSIRPYRPVSCRTYGFYLKDENSSEVKACNLESERWIQESEKEENYLYPITQIKGTLEHLNRDKPSKLLFVWLKEYFSESLK